MKAEKIPRGLQAAKAESFTGWPLFGAVEN